MCKNDFYTGFDFSFLFQKSDLLNSDKKRDAVYKADKTRL
jgi:hypothetical protein